MTVVNRTYGIDENLYGSPFICCEQRLALFAMVPVVLMVTNQDQICSVEILYYRILVPGRFLFV